MPPVLVRPYVRVIPITHIAPAYPRRSPIAPRPVPPDYRPRHLSPAAGVTAEPKPSSKTPPSRRRPTRGRRRTPTLAWGALLIALASTSGLALRAGAAQSAGPVPAAESNQEQPVAGEGQLQTAIVIPATARLAKAEPDTPTQPKRR